MHTFYATVAIIFLTGSSTLYAAAYKGQKIYMDSCKECHGGGQEFAGSKKQRVWERLMKNKGEKLVQIHLSSKKAHPSLDYFKDRSFEKGALHLEDFFIKYASDSGNVPACN
jgi:cytochrome c5